MHIRLNYVCPAKDIDFKKFFVLDAHLTSFAI